MTTSLGHRALGGAGATVLWQAVRLGLLALSILILARLLSPSDYGLLAMVTAIIGIGELFRDLGLSVAAVQSKTLSSAEKSNLFWVNTGIGALLTVLAFVASWPIAALFGQPELVPITQALSITFLLNGLATQFKAQMTRELRFMALGVAETVPQALGLVVAIWIGLSVGDFRALVGQALTIAVVALAMDVALARWRPGLIDRGTSIRRFVKFGGSLTGTQSLAYVSKNIDTVLLGLVFGATQLGFYNRAYQLVVLPLTQLTAPLSRVAIPVLSKLQDDEPNFLRYLRSGQFFTVAVSSIFYGTLVGLATPFVTVALGTPWLPVVPILQGLAVSGIFRAMGQVPYWIFVSKGLAGAQFRFYLWAQPLVVVSIVVGLFWGPLGVAIGCSVGYVLFWFLQMWWSGRVASMNTVPLIVSGLLLASLITVPTASIGLLASWLVPAPGLALIVGGALALGFVSAIVIAVPGYRNHVSTVVRLIRRRT